MKRFFKYIPVVFLAASGIVQAEENPIAEIQLSSRQVQFANTEPGIFLLTVSGASGQIFFQTIHDDGYIPPFSALGDLGPLPDGNYKYELEKLPEFEEEQKRIQVGSFRIADGMIEPNDSK